MLRVWRRAGTVLLVAVGGLVAISADPAAAAAISVTTTDDELNADGDCSLREAVEAANTNAAVDACAAGAGADVITLEADSYAPSVQLVLSDPAGVTIEGATAASTTLTGSDAHRVLDVSDGPLFIADLALVDGDAGAERGGAIRTDDDAVTITASIVSGHNAGHGGAIESVSGAVTITDSTVTDNAAMVDALNGNGGAVNMGSGNVTVRGSTFARNTAVNAGGGIVMSSSALTVDDSTFSANEAQFGGALYNSFGTIAVTNSTLDGNTADSDSGGYGATIEASDLGQGVTLRHVTLTGTIGGYGVRPGAVLIAANTIITDHDDGDCYAPNPSTSLGGNVTTDDTCDLGDATDLTGDPMLAGLGDNGGPTATRLPQAGSPAIDSGVSAECAAADQRGVSRPQDGDDDGTDGCDRGAVELADPTPAPDPDPDPDPDPPGAEPVAVVPTYAG